MKNKIKKILKIILKIHLYFLAITSFLVILYNLIPPLTTPMILYRKAFASYEVKKHRYIKLKNIPSYTKKMLIVSEDSKYYSHFGFDFDAIQRAFKKNQRSGKIKSGGSTITQQAARSIFLTTHRNFFRKYLEAWITLEMEVFMSKNRILELYFNYVEWGKGVFGIETASQKYFKKSASLLTREQSKAMITILANPIKYNPKNYSKSKTMRKRYKHINRWVN